MTAIEVLILASERGGQIVKEILEDLVVTTTKDLKVLDEIETEGLEMRINARGAGAPMVVLLADDPGRCVPRLLPVGAGVLVVAAGGVLSASGMRGSRASRSLDERRSGALAAPRNRCGR